jgi:hypothetical protein
MSFTSSPLKTVGKRSVHPSPPKPSKGPKPPPCYNIGDHVELEFSKDIIPLDFQGVSKAFKAGARGVLTRITTVIFCVSCCRKINEENSSVEIVTDEGSLAFIMFPDDGCLFKLDGILSPLDEYSVFGFKLGDIISDPTQMYRVRADVSDPASESHIGARGRGFPDSIDESVNLVRRIFIQSTFYPEIPDRYIPALSEQYANLPDDSKVFEVYSRVRCTSVYVGGWLRNPEVGQLIAVFSQIACYKLAVIVYVGMDYLILRDSIDYATRRIKHGWGSDPLSVDPANFVDGVLCIRRLDWWMTASCKCVPMLPRRQDRDWGQWPRSDLLHLSDGTN